MMRSPRSVVWPKFQREYFRKKRVDHIKRVCSWLNCAARWNHRRGNFDVALLLMEELAGFVEDSA